MWNLILVRLETVLDRCTVCAKCTIGSEIILDTPEVSKVTRLKWKLDSVHLDIVLISRYDRCMACTEHTTRSRNRFGRT
jgi:hypothetical protein